MVIDGVQPYEWKSELTFSVVAENQKNCQERGRKSVLLVFPVRGNLSYVALQINEAGIIKCSVQLQNTVLPVSLRCENNST